MKVFCEIISTDEETGTMVVRWSDEFGNEYTRNTPMFYFEDGKTLVLMDSKEALISYLESHAPLDHFAQVQYLQKMGKVGSDAVKALVGAKMEFDSGKMERRFRRKLTVNVTTKSKPSVF